MAGRHTPRRLVRRRRAAAVLAVVVLAGGAWFISSRGPGIAVPGDPCHERPPLVWFQGVRLQPVAMDAFRRAETQAGGPIEVVQSYRSCQQQKEACKRLCQNPNGCPGTCAGPGSSWHQLGAAIDISEAALADPKVVAALEANGWCQPLPESDPGHFSYGGCH